MRKILYTTDEIVKIGLGCRRADQLVSIWLLASRDSSTASHLRRSAGAVKMQRPTGRTILTAPSTGTSSRPASHLIIWTEISSPCSQRFRRDCDAALVWHQSILDNRELSELTMHIHSDIAHHSRDSLLLDRQRGTAGTERQLRIRAHNAAGPVAGAANY